MSKLGQQFSELRKSTPKYVQWLLLVAAFIVVLILFTLLMTSPKKTSQKAKTGDVPVKITLSEDTINWSDVVVGTKKTETIIVKTNAPAKASVRRNKDIVGFDVKTTCTDAGEITAAIPCRIILEYAPVAAMKTETIMVFVDWRAVSDPAEMKSSDKITIVLGAIAPEVSAPKPIVLPEPIAETEPIVAKADEIKTDIKSIAPSDPFADEKPLPKPVADTKPIITPSESCSDFAFPGYDAAGNQIGWIKPERGSYYFHPFSDRNCKNPTGIYNPATGIITDINGNGNRIGTDSEHIGYSITAGGTLPVLSDAPSARRANVRAADIGEAPSGGMGKIVQKMPNTDVEFASSGQDTVTNTIAYDRTFILRQYKPIPATIVSDVRADPSLYNQDNSLPVRATVDRNVYSDNGRTVIIPAGTLLLGYLTGKMPGPYTAIGRMEINWYQFVLPNGVEFNFNGTGKDPFSGDAQGRVGVPGRGSTDYMEQFVMPMLTAIVPAAVNMIAPVADKFVNQIDLDNNTVVQSGTLRSSELAKNEIITAWNQVAQKLLVDMMDNTVPPFTIPAGTRITVYSPSDLQVTCGSPETNNKKCAVAPYSNRPRPDWTNKNAYFDYNDGSWVGQARSFNWAAEYCISYKDGKLNLSQKQLEELANKGLDYSDVLFYCQSNQYKAINNARQEAIYQNQQDPNNTNSIANKSQDTKTYNEQVLGLKYNEDGSIQNPYQSEPVPVSETITSVITCEDGMSPDINGCCTGEIYTDMGEQGFNCCPQSGGDCFPPIIY